MKCLLMFSVPMEFPLKFDTVKSRWSIVYCEGSQVIISKIIRFLSRKIDFVDIMQHFIRVFNVCQSAH